MNKKITPISIVILLFLSSISRAQELYIGFNYHPHDDKNIESESLRFDIVVPVPDSVMVRQIDQNHVLYLNMSPRAKRFN